MRLYGATRPDGHLYRGQRKGAIDGVCNRKERRRLRSVARRQAKREASASVSAER